MTSFKYANPHSQLYFDVKDDKGNVVHWAAEMRNPRNLQSFGHSEKELNEKFAPGTQVTVTGNPSRAGAPVVEFGKAVLPDGWCLCNHEGGIGTGRLTEIRGAYDIGINQHRQTRNIGIGRTILRQPQRMKVSEPRVQQLG